MRGPRHEPTSGLNLTPSEQRVWVLRHLPHREIAIQLSVSPKTVDNYMMKAKQKMRDLETLRELRDS